MDTNRKQLGSRIRPFIAGLVVGVLAGMLGMGLHQSNKMGRQEIRSEAEKKAPCPPAEQQQAGTPPKPTKDAKDFEFYGVLENAPVTPARPDLEQPLVPPTMAQSPPRDAPPARPPTAPAASKPFYLQLASFQAAADAEELRARIVLAGAPVIVVAMEIPEKGLYYRVRLGPFASREELAQVKDQLAQSGIDLESGLLVR
jgi:cell division protein FtsN